MEKPSGSGDDVLVELIRDYGRNGRTFATSCAIDPNDDVRLEMDANNVLASLRKVLKYIDENYDRRQQ